MKGYFSRISKQSGLRFSGRNAQPSQYSGGQPAAANLVPTETEVAIMSPPTIPVERSIRERESHPTDALMKKTAPGQGQNPNRRSDARLVTAPVGAVTHPSLVQTGNNLLSDSPPSELSVAQRTVFQIKDHEQLRASTAKSLAVEPPESKEFISAESLSSSEKQKKEYFSKTAEIIEKGETGTTEIRDTLFHDIREWVAAAPVDREMPAADAPGRPEVTITTQVAQSRSPGVVTVREKSLRQNAETSEPMEQSFDLSIGTISVVIENAEKTAQPVPPQTNNRPQAPEPQREFSRLSRNYL